MAKQIILILIMFATLAYATFTYWPLIAPLFPAKPAAKSAVSAPMVAPIGTTSVESAVNKPAEIDEIVVPTAEVKLLDPFALRIEVKTRAEEPLPVVKPPGPEPAKPVEPQLEGIWIDADRRIAFISGQALSVGGAVLGWKVSSIGKERVILQKGSLTKTLKVEGK